MRRVLRFCFAYLWAWWRLNLMSGSFLKTIFNLKKTMIYFAKLDGDIIGIDHYCRFEATNDAEAQEIADQYAEKNYSEYAEPFDEDGGELFFADIEPWNDDEHEEYFGQACFTDYLRN
jgi:hypothetical protein